MIVNIFSVDDKLIGFGQLFTDHNVDTAKRAFTGSILHMLRDDSPSPTVPDDLDLYVFGTFDSDTGKIDLFERPELVISGKSIVLGNKGVDNNVEV